MTTQDLDDKKLYQLVLGIADYCYQILSEIPEDEKYPMLYTLRSNAFEITGAIAEAYASVDPRDRHWKLGSTRRSIFGLQNALQQAHKRGYIKLNPDVMLHIKEAITIINTDLGASKLEFAEYLAMLDPDTYKHKNGKEI